MPDLHWNHPSRRRLLAGAAAATTLIAAPAIVRAQANALKIAVLLPRSGYLAPAGQSCYRGAADRTSGARPIRLRVELIHIDTESNVDIARTQTERAINEGAQCIVGAFDFRRARSPWRRSASSGRYRWS